jgi:hypothetical protein
MEWSHFVYSTQVAGSYKYGNETSGNIQDRELIEQFRYYY